MTGLVDKALSRDRRLVAGVLVAVTAVAMIWTLGGEGGGMSASDMTAMTGMQGALIAGLPDMAMGGWTWRYGLVIFVMWWLMMMAMMVPSVAPTILLYGALHPSRGAGGMLSFLTGYLLVWAAFSLAATLLQAGLVSIAWMSDMYMNLASRWLGVGVLFAAGLYQLTPVKAACLQSCRSPAEALISRRRTGRLAAFRMGMVHGRYCVGCCWALMALLFVGGIMNLWWILGVAALVAVEKLSPAGEGAARALGVGLVLGAGLMALWAARMI